MEKFFLNFCEKKIEESYKASAFGMGSNLFVLIMLTMLFDICAYGFPGMANGTSLSSMREELIGATFLLIFLFVLGFILRKRIKILRYYCAILLIVYALILIENVRMEITYFHNCDPVLIIAVMISVNFGMNCIIYFNFSWVFFVSFNIFVYADMMIRVFNDSDWQPEKYLKFIQITIVNVFISYYIEKSTRRNYLALYNSNEFAKTFQHLIDEVLPTPIIIKKVKDFSICFYNKAIIQMMKPDITKSSQPKPTKKEIDIKIKQVINEKMQMMKINEKQEDEQNLKNILDHFDEELLKQKEKNLLLDTFLQKKILLPKSQIFSFDEKNNFTIDNHRDEEDKYFDVKIQKILWQNEECFMIIFTDITSIISLAHLKDIDIYKNRLLATVSHDLRTPINGMMGMIETVSNDLKEKKNKRLLKMAMKFGHLLLSMINDILDFSKISNCQLSLNFELVDVVSLIKDVCDLIKFQIKNKGINFLFEKVNLPEKIIISTDPNRLKQILINLLSNSLKFTFKGYIKLVLEQSNQNMLKFSVEDSGIGIKNENISKLFTLFGKLKQEDSSINKQGVGLGLVISQNLSKLLYNGNDNGIQVESVWGEGSKFWFILPGDNKVINEGEADFSMHDVVNQIKISEIHDKMTDFTKHAPPQLKKIMVSDPHNESMFFFKRGTIMIVDDDQINLLVAKEYMKFFNLDYILVNNGKEALNLIQ